MNHPLGHINYWLERTRGRLSWIGTFSMMAVFLKTFHLAWWWSLGLIPLAIISVWIDKTQLAPGEREADSKINPEWRKMMKILDEIRAKIK